MSPPGEPRPFRFGVVAAGLHDARSWRDRCREVEDLGYDSLHVPDGFAPQLGPLAGLAAAAVHTSSLRLGMLVANNDLRHPVVLAQELATIDVVSGGRLEWGMGAGWDRRGYRSVGLAFDPPAERVDRLVESVARMRASFGGPSPSLQHPHPPLLIGAAERRLLTFAGATADRISINRSLTTVSFGGRPPRKRPDEAVADQVAWVRQGAARRRGEVELSMEADPPVVVTADRRSALAEVAAATGRPVDQLEADPRTWVGSVAGIVESLQRQRQELGVSHWVVYEPHLRDAAPIVAALAGT